MDLRIIHDPNNEASRNFAEANPSIPLIDWYGDLEGRLTLIAKGVRISDFPTVVDMQSGKTSTAPISMEEAEAAIEAELAPKVIAKLIIRRRLRAAGLEGAADAALASDTQAQKDWNDAVEINKDDQQVRALLTAISADVDAVLA